jgi:hypothetical protein
MLAADLTGLGTSAVVIAAASLLVTTRVRGLTPGRRALTCGGVAILALVPFGDLSLAGYLRGLTGDLSITTLVLLLRAIARQPREPSLGERGDVALQVVLTATAVALYPLALGLGTFDPYRLGYASPWLLSVLFLAALVGWWRRYSLVTWCLALAVLAYSVGWYESNNLWDYLVDPLVGLYALSALLLRAARRPTRSNIRGAEARS